LMFFFWCCDPCCNHIGGKNVMVWNYVYMCINICDFYWKGKLMNKYTESNESLKT
jgi:hypothetical protein